MKKSHFQSTNNIWIVLFFIIGFFFIGLYIFINIVDDSNVLIFLLAGIIICLCSAVMWSANRETDIRIDDNYLIAKYTLFIKKKYKLSEIAFTKSHMDTLEIILKNGKIITITNVGKASVLSSVIKRRITVDSASKSEVLTKTMKRYFPKRKKYLKLMCLCFLLMFVFLAILLISTQGKDIEQFTKANWLIFNVIIVLSGINLLPLFYFAKNAGDMLQIVNSFPTIRKMIIKNSPLLVPNVIKVYTSPDYIQRITIASKTAEKDFYFIAQKFDTDFNFCKTYESETFSDLEELTSRFENFIEISENWVKNK